MDDMICHRDHGWFPPPYGSVQPSEERLGRLIVMSEKVKKKSLPLTCLFGAFIYVPFLLLYRCRYLQLPADFLAPGAGYKASGVMGPLWQDA